MDSMTEPQRIAFGSPCLLGVETLRPRFAHRTRLQRLCLTVDAGYA